VKNGNHAELGWPSSAYGVSKLGVTLMTSIQQREHSEDSSKPDVVINAVSRYYLTDMYTLLLIAYTYICGSFLKL